MEILLELFIFMKTNILQRITIVHPQGICFSMIQNYLESEKKKEILRS